MKTSFTLLLSGFSLAFSSWQLNAQNEVGLAIDRAIEFAQASRLDLTKITLQGLLKEKLLPIDRAAVLYNLSTLYAHENNYAEALSCLRQIDDETYEQVKEISPLLATQIAYSGAVYSIRYVKASVNKVAKGELLLQPELIDTFQKTLDAAKDYAKDFDESLKNGSTLIRRRIHEELSEADSAFSLLKTISELEQLTKSQFLDRFSQLLYEKIEWGKELACAKEQKSSDSKWYLESFQTQALPQLSLFLERLLLYLQAPAKETDIKRNEFLRDELRLFRQNIQVAINNDDPPELLSNLQELLQCVFIVQGQMLNRDVEAILDARLEAAAEYELMRQSKTLASFWQDVWQDDMSFNERYLQVVANSTQNSARRAILHALNDHLAKGGNEPSVATALDDIFYWKVLSRDEKATFLLLAQKLHGKKLIDHPWLDKVLVALRDRLLAMGMPKAEEALSEMKKETSRTLLFQDLMQGWFLADPKGAISFLVDALQEEMRALLAPLPTSSMQYLAVSDFQLLYHLLRNETAKPIQEVRQGLAKEISWFRDEKRELLSYYKLSLDLDWLKEMLVFNQGTLESITHNVDFGVEFQKKTMGLVRFSREKDFTELLQLLTSMQHELATAIARDLTALPKKGKKIKQVQELIDEVKRRVDDQVRELSVMQTILELLEKASKILHSMQSESESEQSSELTQNEDLSMQVQNKALRLTPENAIRLLQEMDKQDRSLQVKEEQQATGPKPW